MHKKTSGNAITAGPMKNIQKNNNVLQRYIILLVWAKKHRVTPSQRAR